MALRYFRKHKKIGHVLLLAALFAMVTFGSLGTVLWRIARRPENPVVYRVYGKDVTRRQHLRVGADLAGAAGYQRVVSAYAQWLARATAPEDRAEAMRKVRVLTRHSTPLPLRYQEAADSEEGPGPRDEVIKATVILLKEAERAGVEVSEEAVRRYLGEWSAAGVEGDLVTLILRDAFPSRNRDQSMRWLMESLRQEMTLSIYLESMAGGSKVLREEVEDEFRRISPRVKIGKVAFRAADFLDEVNEPTDDQLREQFEAYKAVSAGPGPDNPHGFGYRIPDRVRFGYLKASMEVATAEVEVTEEEIKSYYERVKDPWFVVEEEEAEESVREVESGNGGPAAAEEARPGSPETPSEDDTGEESPEGDGDAEESRTLNAPAADPEAETADADAETGEEPAMPDGEAAADGAEMAVPTDEADESPQAGTESGPAGAEEGIEVGPLEPESLGDPEQPEKQFRPFEQVRDELEREIRGNKAAELCEQWAKEAMETLMLRPRLELRHVADGRRLTLHESDGWVSRDEAGQVPGLGSAFKREEAGDRMRRGGRIGFSELVFSVAPLVEEPRVYVDRPFGLLEDSEGNRYIVSITGVKPNHEPESLDSVRGRVTEDLRKKVAYERALARAEEVAAEAKEKGLLRVADQWELEVEEPGSPMARRVAESGDAIAGAVFDAIDAGERVGTVEDPAEFSVAVFQVKEVKHYSRKEYLERRPELAQRALWRGQSELLDELIDPERAIRRSRLEMTDQPIRKQEKETEEEQ